MILKKKMDKIKEFIKRANWVEAKTYKETAPHEYVVKTPKETRIIIEFAKYIRKYGYKGTFWGKEYTYLDLDGYKYWTMDKDVEETELINREKINK